MQMKNELTHAEFMNHLSKIKEGCTKEQLLAEMGEPDELHGEHWYYHWEEPNGGYFDIACFIVKNGIVTKIEMQSGHRTVR
jgi:outer membrane protein assembly factor BamE (lipoprotein component of BamABCDE complex)